MRDFDFFGKTLKILSDVGLICFQFIHPVHDVMHVMMQFMNSIGHFCKFVIHWSKLESQELLDGLHKSFPFVIVISFNIDTSGFRLKQD